LTSLHTEAVRGGAPRRQWGRTSALNETHFALLLPTTGAGAGAACGAGFRTVRVRQLENDADPQAHPAARLTSFHPFDLFSPV
jgi:hypothetical protein